MSRDFMEDYLQHSWGKKPEQKAREKQYNKEYYQKHKDKWKNLNDEHWKDDAESEMKDYGHKALRWTKVAEDAEKQNTGDSAHKLYLQSKQKNLRSKKERDALRKRSIAIGAAENERSKAIGQYKANSERNEQKAKVYFNNLNKDIDRRERKKKIDKTIDSGKKFVSKLLDKIF